jgi:nucleoside-diphosphate-sugar epimerase
MTCLPTADLDHILSHTADLWPELRGQRLFITGGTGFFGCWLLESLAWANKRFGLGAEALILTRSVEAFRRKAPHLAANPAFRFHEGDVRNFAFPDGEFPLVIHAATAASNVLNRGGPLIMLDTTIEGARHTLDFAAAHGAKKFLLASSGAVYGRQPPGMTHVPEDYVGGPDPMDAVSAYGEGKRVAEFLGAAYAARGGPEFKIARCYATLGPRMPLDMHYAAGDFMIDLIAGRPIIVKGDGTPCRSYLYAADLAIWLWTILLRGRSCRPYNVGSEHLVSIADLARVIAALADPPAEVRILGTPQPGAAPARYAPCTRRAREELGLAEHLNLAESLRRTIAWHRGQAATGS